MTKLTRRQFLAGLGTTIAAASFVDARRLTDPAIAPVQARPAQLHHVYVAKNGTPVTNVQEVVELAGGIERFIGVDDVVVLKPNGQWPRQGYTHTECMKALIDVILARPGGFGGEVIVAEHVQRKESDTLSGNYCWNMPAGSNRNNNWPDMNYMELMDDYHDRGIHNVTAIPLINVGQADISDNWEAVSGPADLSPGKHGWVRLPAYTAANGRSITPSYPILRSAYSGKLIDLHRGGGVWENGGYNSQQVRFIPLPTLNNHGWGSEDYAGITSAVKCHIGFQEGTSLHYVGYGYNRPDAVGESVGYLITTVLVPTFYLTCAEYSGHVSRTGGATHTRTVGLCADPVTLDYWMCKYVLYPCNEVSYFNPDNDNNTRQTLLGCHGEGVGTLNEAEMDVQIVDVSQLATVALRGAPADGAIHLSWQVTGPLPGGLTWEIAHTSSAGEVDPAVSGLVAETRAHTLDGLSNGVVYTVTLRGKVDDEVVMSDTATVMATDKFVYLPLVQR
ncbi:MAG TPA: hypothetical protein ENN19_15600 [Chloroflexi bacterium]|nr:hypothetical protein [Chloroflexota bacterium]